METDTSNGLSSLPNLDTASCMIRVNTHKLQLSDIKINVALIFRDLVLDFYSVSLLVGGYSRLFSFYIEI